MSTLVDYYLHIDGVQGESHDAQYPGLIQLLSWNWGEENQGHWNIGSGGGSGKVQMRDFKFKMFTNKATPKLFVLCATGEHIPTAKLIARKSGRGQQDFMTVTFSNILISSFETGGNLPSSDTEAKSNSSEGSLALPVDAISMNFARIEVEYREQQVDGTMGAVIKSGYDLKLNQRV